MNTNPKTGPQAPAASDAGGVADDAKAEAQRQALLDAERKAHEKQPRGFKDDALTDKKVHVEPDGTGPSPMGSMDPPKK